MMDKMSIEFFLEDDEPIAILPDNEVSHNKKNASNDNELHRIFMNLCCEAPPQQDDPSCEFSELECVDILAALMMSSSSRNTKQQHEDDEDDAVPSNK
jgi:hypothetical protein